MSEVLVATVALDINEVAEEQIQQLTELDETLAGVIQNFDAKELMTECVEKVLEMYRESGQYKIEDGFLMTVLEPGWRTNDSAGNKILGVVKSGALPRGIGFVVSPNGRVGFIDHRGGYGASNDSTAIERFKQEAKDLLLTQALKVIFNAAGFSISDFQMERSKCTGALESVNMTGVRQ